MHSEMDDSAYEGNEKMTEAERNAIVSDLFSDSIYVRVPEVSIDSSGKITNKGNLHRRIVFWFDDKDYERSGRQKRVMNKYLQDSKPSFSGQSECLVAPSECPMLPTRAMEKFQELFGEPAENPEMAQDIVELTMGAEWVMREDYYINENEELFEKIHLPLIKTRVDLTSATFERYFEHLKKVEKQLKSYFREELVLYSEWDEFSDKNPQINRLWADFFRSSPHIYLNSKGEQANQADLSLEGEELESKGFHLYLPIRKPHEVVEYLLASRVFFDDIDNLHWNNSLEFFIDSEITRIK